MKTLKIFRKAFEILALSYVLYGAFLKQIGTDFLFFIPQWLAVIIMAILMLAYPVLVVVLLWHSTNDAQSKKASYKKSVKSEGLFVVRRGVPHFPYYWKDGEWIKDKNAATKYTWDEAEKVANELNCAFTDAE